MPSGLTAVLMTKIQKYLLPLCLLVAQPALATGGIDPHEAKSTILATSQPTKAATNAVTKVTSVPTSALHTYPDPADGRISPAAGMVPTTPATTVDNASTVPSPETNPAHQTDSATGDQIAPAILIVDGDSGDSQDPNAAVHPDDLWQRLRNGMSMPEMDSPRVTDNERWFASRQGYMTATLNRASLYLFHIVEELDKRHMPLEIALLPIVESSYNPKAVSSSDASGIWQFLPSTGKVFGLKQNGWYDGRCDIVNGTHAALDYLERLHGMFNDWELALAAYNCGEGCVARAIARNRARGLATDFLSLDLPPETRNYVPRLIAIRNVVRDPGQFGISLNAIPNAPAFRKVTLPYPVEAKTAAKLAQMDMDDFLALNPGFRRKVIYSESQNTLLLPPEKIDQFKANLEAAEAANIQMHTFHAPKGALLSKLADQFNVTIAWLKDHNPLEVKRGKLAQSQTLMLPAATSQAALTAKPIVVAQLAEPEPHPRHAKSRPARTRQGKTRIHTVRKGETLYSLAKQYKVNVADIVTINRSPKRLHPGDRIHIPSEG
jgi:membrane-bound lytic murein transglycosylase D